MSRRGCLASSPSVAAASNPANDRKPNTTPRNSALVSVPGWTANGVNVTPLPPGALPPASLARMITETTRMSRTVSPSTVSRNRVPRRTGDTVNA